MELFLYSYALGDNEVKIEKDDVYSNVKLQTVEAWVDTSGTYRFEMYDTSDQNTVAFLKEVKKTLIADKEAAKRAEKSANGRLIVFKNNFPSIITEKEESDD